MTGENNLGHIEEFDENCEKSPDGVHCVHWYDGEPCCFCGTDEGPIEGEDE